jgi:hypothetical protein
MEPDRLLAFNLGRRAEHPYPRPEPTTTPAWITTPNGGSQVRRGKPDSSEQDEQEADFRKASAGVMHQSEGVHVWHLSCPAPPVSRHGRAADLLEFERATGGSAQVRTARRSGEEYLLERGLFRPKSTGAVVQPAYLEFAFPYYWHYDVCVRSITSGAQARTPIPGWRRR